MSSLSILLNWLNWRWGARTYSIFVSWYLLTLEFKNLKNVWTLRFVIKEDSMEQEVDVAFELISQFYQVVYLSYQDLCWKLF